MSVLAPILGRDKELILQRWTEHVREQLEVGQVSAPALRDHLPLVLGELEAALRAGRSPFYSPAAAQHGRQRERIAFDVTQLVREYGILREVIFDLAEQQLEVPIPLREIRVLTDFFSTAIAEGVGEHERHHAEQAQHARALAEAEKQRQHDLFMQAPVAIAILEGPTHLFTFANPGYRALVNRRDVVGKTLAEALPDLIDQGFDLLLDQVMSTGEPYVASELPIKLAHHQEGELLFLNFAYTPKRNADGKVDGVLMTGWDVTEQVRARERVESAAALARERQKESEFHLRRWNEVVETMSDAYFAMDREFRIVQVNKNHEVLSRRPRSETLGRVLWEIFPATAEPGSLYFEAYTKCMRERVPVEFVAHYHPLDLWTDVSAFPTSDGGISVFFRDVSKARRQEALEKERMLFEQQLIGIVSHDLRNPLGIVLMASKMLRSTADLPEGAVRHIGRILNAAERANRLVRDLLDFTQARLAGGVPVEPKPSDLHAIIKQALEELQLSWPNRQIELVLEGRSDGSWDPDRLAQVIENLVTNALKYSAPTSQILLKASAQEEGDQVTLVVHNHGAPVPEERRPFLFDPLQRGAAHADVSRRSVGLGLYIVKQIVEAHGGGVTLRSDAESGTTVTVKLPRVCVARAKAIL
jgi:sigma-B regulation protein RsbU (phosphoserine phosphatase)